MRRARPSEGPQGARSHRSTQLKIIILGAGQVGRTAAYHLAREEANDVTVVDTSDDLLRDLQDRIDIRTVQGNAASPKTLEMAGALRSRAIPHHLAVWGKDSRHDYDWWQRQARHYLGQLF